MMHIPLGTVFTPAAYYVTEYFIFCQVDRNMFCLIDTLGNRWAKPVSIPTYFSPDNRSVVTDEEWRSITCGTGFESTGKSLNSMIKNKYKNKY